MIIELVLFLLSGLTTGRLLHHGYIHPMIQGGGRILFVDTVLLVAFVVVLGLWLALGEKSARRRFFIILGACLIANTWLLMKQWDIRSQTERPHAIQDGAIQTEEATRFLFRRINPYAADFQSSRFGAFPSPYAATIPNVAWTHFVYPPANLLVAIPVVLAQNAGSRVDMSLPYTIILWATLLLLLTTARSWEMRSRLTLLTIGNPFIWFYPVAGFNDVLFVFGLILAIWADQRHRWGWSGIGMAVAIAAKQTSWIILPIWLLWLYFRWRQGRLAAKAIQRTIITTAGVTTLFYLPFIIWNLPALWDDLIRYPSGAIPFSYPISGSTLLQYLRIGGLIDSAWTTMVIWPIQLVVIGGLSWLSTRWLRRSNHALFLATAIFVLLGSFLFSRYLLENYLQALMILAVAAYAFQTPTHEP